MWGRIRPSTDQEVIGRPRSVSPITSVLALAVGKALAIVSWTALIALAGSGLPPSDYGRLLLLSNLAAFVVILGSFGQPQVLLYRSGRLGTASRSSTHHANFTTGVRVLLCMTLVSTAVATGVLFLQGELHYGVLTAWCVWTIGSTWQALMAEEAKAVSNMWTAGLTSNSAAAGGAAVLAGALLIVIVVHNLASSQLDLTLILLALALASLACSGWLLASYLLDRSRHDPLQLADTSASLSAPQEGVWRSGALVTANTLLTFVIGQSDIWWASLWHGVEAAGSYGTAAYLARFCSLLGILLAGAYAGRFAAQLARGELDAVARSVRTLSLLAAAAGVLIWGVLAAAHEMGILGRWFHLDAAGSFHAFLTLGAGHVLGSLFGFGPVLLASAGRFRDLLAIAGVSAAMTVVVSGVAVPTTGLGGLGAAFGLSYVAFVYGCHWRCRRVLGVSPYESRRSA